MLDVFEQDGTLILDMSDAVTGDSFAKLVGLGINAQDTQRALMEHPDAESVEVRMNSPGGSVWEGVAIGNILRADPRDVQVRVTGLAASIASVIAMAGDEIVMEPGSMMMLHQPRMGIMLDATKEDLESTASMLEKISESMLGIYDRRTGEASSREELRAMMDAETWLTGPEAVEAGLATRVGSDASPAPSAEPDAAWQLRRGAVMVAFRRMPAAARHGQSLGWSGPGPERLTASIRRMNATGIPLAQLIEPKATKPPKPRARGNGGSASSKEHEVNTKILKILGLEEGASEDEVFAALQEREAEAAATNEALRSAESKAKSHEAEAAAIRAASEATSHKAKVDELVKGVIPASREIVASMCWTDDDKPYPAGLERAEALLKKNPHMRVSSYTTPVKQLRSDPAEGSPAAASDAETEPDGAPVLYKLDDGSVLNLTAFTGATMGDHRKLRVGMEKRIQRIPNPTDDQRRIYARYKNGEVN